MPVMLPRLFHLGSENGVGQGLLLKKTVCLLRYFCIVETEIFSTSALFKTSATVSALVLRAGPIEGTRERLQYAGKVGGGDMDGKGCKRIWALIMTKMVDCHKLCILKYLSDLITYWNLRTMEGRRGAASTSDKDKALNKLI